MSKVFGSVYSGVYDTLYKDKDYAEECDLLKYIFNKHCNCRIKTVLDLGCGTGSHAIPLANEGFEVTGIDMSAGMLSAARAKAESKKLPIRFQEGDIRQLNLGKTFDAVLMMFAVLGYQLENKDVLSALKSARKHLNPDGILVLDVWYGPAVLAQRPSDKVKIISESDKKILRIASGELDTFRHTCTVHYDLWQLNRNILESEIKEEHKMRFFFPLELDFFLEMAGFKLIRLGSFPEINRDPDETSWNAIVIAATK